MKCSRWRGGSKPWLEQGSKWIKRRRVDAWCTGTDAATLLDGADIIPLGSMGGLQVGITPVYKSSAAGTGITLPGTQVSIGTGGIT